jgi:hypothetical protein
MEWSSYPFGYWCGPLRLSTLATIIYVLKVERLMRIMLVGTIGIIFGLCLSLIATNSVAQWWNPFAPSDYEECAESAAREAKTSVALNILLESCNAKFRGRRKPGGGYAFLDTRQNRSFPIAGPNPTPAELSYIDAQYSLFLKEQQDAATAYAERTKQLQEIEAARQKTIQDNLADLERRRQTALIPHLIDQNP